MSKLSTLYRTCSWLLSLGYVAYFALNLLIARRLSMVDFGDLHVAISILTVALMTVLLSTNDSLIRSLPDHFTCASGWLFRTLNRQMRLILSICAISIAIGALLISTVSLLNHYAYANQVESHPIILCCWLLPLIAIVLFATYLHQHIDHQDRSGWLLYGVLGLTFVGVAAAAVFFVSLHHAVLVYAFFLFFAAGAILVGLYHGLYKDIQTHSINYQEKPISTVFTYLWMTSLTFIGLRTSSLVLLEILGTEQQVGLFAAILMVMSCMWLLDRITKLSIMGLDNATHMQNDPIITLHLQEKQIQRTTLTTLAITSLWTLCCLRFGRTLLGWFGPEYMIGYSALVVVGLGYWLNHTVSVCKPLLEASGFQAPLTVGFASTLSLTTLCSLFLIPHYGVLGAALSVTLPRIVLAAACLSLVHRKLAVKPYVIL